MPPVVLSPIFTLMSASNGKKMSTREPNLINPRWVEISASSPAAAYVTIRRANAPAIWRTRICSPDLARIKIEECSFSVLDFGR